MAGKTRQVEEPADPAVARLALARLLVRKQARSNGMEDRDLAKAIGRDESTISKLLNGKRVSDDTWFRVGKEFGWGSWIDFVKDGNLGAVTRYGTIDEEIRDYAIERMREIAGIESDS